MRAKPLASTITPNTQLTADVRYGLLGAALSMLAHEFAVASTVDTIRVVRPPLP